MFQGFTRMAPLRLGEQPTNSDTTSMLLFGPLTSPPSCRSAAWAAPASLPSLSARLGSTSGPSRQATYSYGTRFMPSRVAVTTTHSATLYSAMRSCSGTWRSSSSTGGTPAGRPSCPPAWGSP